MVAVFFETPGYEDAVVLGVVYVKDFGHDAVRIRYLENQKRRIFCANPKPEIRRPKEGRSAKSEIRKQAASRRALRISDFGLLSAFGSRVSDFTVICLQPTPVPLPGGPAPGTVAPFAA